MSDMLDWRDLARSTCAGGGCRSLSRSSVRCSAGTLTTTSTPSTGQPGGLRRPVGKHGDPEHVAPGERGLAVFYADLARRRYVLVPVRERLGLTTSLDELRN